MEKLLFDSYTGLLRVAIVGILAYIALVITLRISGKRTLTKLNAFDLVVTVALGSTLATVLLSKDVALAEGLLAFALLAFLQYCITWLSLRWSDFERFVKSEPSLLVHDGELLIGACRRNRVTRNEISAAVRGAGFSDLSSVQSVVLETDGSLSVVAKQKTLG